MNGTQLQLVKEETIKLDGNAKRVIYTKQQSIAEQEVKSIKDQDVHSAQKMDTIHQRMHGFI